MKRRQESGFALIAALLAIWILTAMGLLVFTVTTQDVRISSRMVGEKKAFFATEAGVHKLVEVFNPLNLVDPANYNKDVVVDPVHDKNLASQFRIATPAVPTKGPAAIPLSGYSSGGGQQWGSTRYVSIVTGRNTDYQSTVQVDAGVGFGPVEITTAYR
jgi:Tfp pilus assembly protein PilX